MIYLINEDNFVEKISKGYSIVDFFATWCMPCKMLASVLEKVETSYTNCNFYKIDVDISPNITSKYFIMSVPTILIFKDGEKVDQSVGALDEKKLKEFLDKNIKI